jgi:hypothetical protein
MCVTPLAAFWILDFMQDKHILDGDFPHYAMEITLIRSI